MSFLLLLGGLSECGVFCIFAHLCIGRRLCIFVFTRLCTHLDGHHVPILGQSSHRCIKGSKLVTLGFLVASFRLLLAVNTTATMDTAMALLPTNISFSTALADNALLGRQ